ncbi:MAG: TorF family putative porin [bacterium]
MKALVLSIFAILATLCASKAENNITLTTYAANHYLSFGSGRVLSKDPVIQTDVRISYGTGIYLDLWGSRSLKGKANSRSLGNEIDYGLGWRGLVAPHLTLDVGVTYFDEPKVGRLGAGDIIYTHANLTRDYSFAAVTLGYENYVTMPRSGFQGGNLCTLGVSKGWSLCSDKVGVHASAAAVYDTGTLGTKPGFLFRGNAGVDYKQSKHVTFNLIGANWYAPVTGIGTKANIMWMSGMTVSF